MSLTGAPALSADRAVKVPKSKAGSTRKALTSQAARSLPSSQLAFADRPTPTEPGATDADEPSPRDAELDLDEHAEVFFNAAEPSAASDHEHAAESLAPVAQDREPVAPHVLLRRAQLARYVRAAVALSAALCFAAVVRGAVARVTHEHEATAHAMTSDPDRAAISHQEPHALEATAPVSSAPIAPAQADPGGAPIAASSAPAAAAVPPKSAAEEKRSTRVALERGKLKDAIAAGERAIALDPTDGESWLLLGAAYQDSGNAREARRCFAACAKEGKRGPIRECRMMLR